LTSSCVLHKNRSSVLSSNLESDQWITRNLLTL
jgi:hypothetical protein